MNTAILTTFLLLHPQPLATLAKHVIVVGPIALQHFQPTIVPPRKVTLGPLTNKD